MRKRLRYLEAAASISLVLSKYFLAISSVLGWWLSIVGYVLTAILNIKIKLKIIVPLVFGLALLSAYGLYKWSYELVGLQIIDIIVIGLSIFFASILVIREARDKKPLWITQTSATILFSFAFITLGMKMEIGWYALLVGHINNIYMYYHKKAYIILVLQVVSIVIVLVKLFA